MEPSKLTERLARLSPAKRALLELKLKQQGAALSSHRSIPRRAGGGPGPLSFAQRRLWFLSQLEPDSDAYHQGSAIRLRGALDVDALRAALRRLAARHEILRTRIPVIDGIPHQVVDEGREVDLPLVDLGSTPASERESAARRILDETNRRPFDLAGDLMVRALLLRLGGQEHILLLVKHHILTDGWSSGIFWRELAAFYREALGGEPAALPELPVQYQDYAEWQHRHLQGDVLEGQLSYWKKRLQGVGTLRLPADGAAAPLQAGGAATQSILLSPELSQSLKALSRERNATLFMTLLAAFQILLCRYSGQEDIAVGTPIAGRTRAELEGLIGFFVNTLVLRADLSGDPGFFATLERVREICLGAYDHQDLPFEKLVEELQPARSLTRSPLFQVMFALRNAPERKIDLPGLAVSRFEMAGGTAKFELALDVSETPEGLMCAFEYDAGLYRGDTIERMARHFQELLRGIVADPDGPISALPLLTPAERRQLLFEWNGAPTDSPRERCIHDLLQARAEQTPGAAAVALEDRQLTYRELNQRANRLAHYLKTRGVGPEVLVGLCLERSLEMIVAVLAVLKAGGAYVPLDPNYPKDWLSFVLRDSRVPVLVTQSRLSKNLPEHEAAVVCLDSAAELIARESGENPPAEVAGENPAYVIYTSGSTGRPKGVVVLHRSLANFISSVRALFALGPGDRVLQFASLSFDTAVEEIFSTLLAGATLVLRTDSMLDSISTFLEKCRAWRLTVLDLPTAYWHEMADRMSAERLALPASLRLVVIGGERAIPDRLQRWREHAGGRVRLLNGYGPTEATVAVTFWELPESLPADAPVGEVPIGRPIPNCQAYVLDQRQNPSPVGVPGELYLGGACLARGYLRRPELTAEKFVAHPFSDEPGARLYRSGDLARYRSDGNLEFIGRIDHQVKIHGHRIEPGEIEAALCRHPGVREAVVTARENGRGEKQLVAYVVPAEKIASTTGELREFLRRTLPGPMIPAAFVVLPSFPLAPSGKVDRLALPAPGQDRPVEGRDYAAPNDPVECQLAEVWEELLEVRPVGVLDDFFALGGHSLLAARLMHRIEEIYHKKIPLAAMFAEPTIRQLAKAIVNQYGPQFDAPLIPIQPDGSRPPFFFLHGDFFGGGIYAAALARGLGKDQPFYVLNPHGLDGESPPATIEAMAASYIEIIRAARPGGPYILGGYCNGGVVAYEMARQLRRRKQRVELVALISARVKNIPGIRVLRGLVSGLAYLRGLESEEKRHLLFRSLDRYFYYLDRLRDVAQLPVTRQLAWGLRQLKGGFLQPPPTLADAVKPERRGDAGSSEFEVKRLLAWMGKAMESYVPRRYPGRVVLFQPSERFSRGGENPAMEWRRIAPAIEIQMVPGGHISCVSTHVKTLATLIQSRLDGAAPAEPALDSVSLPQDSRA